MERIQNYLLQNHINLSKPYCPKIIQMAVALVT